MFELGLVYLGMGNKNQNFTIIHQKVIYHFKGVKVFPIGVSLIQQLGLWMCRASEMNDNDKIVTYYELHLSAN